MTTHYLEPIQSARHFAESMLATTGLPSAFIQERVGVLRKRLAYGVELLAADRKLPELKSCPRTNVPEEMAARATAALDALESAL